MADIRIKDLATTATTTASDDFMAVDGVTNGTRKLSAATPAFLTSVTTPSLTAPAATNLTLAGGAGNSSIILTPAGTGGVGIGTTTPASFVELKAAAGSLQQRFTDVTAGLIGFIGGANGILSGAAANTMGVRAENGLFLSGAGNTNLHLLLNSSSQVLIGTTDATGLTGGGGLKIASTTAGSSGAGALVVQGGISAGQSAQASYFGGDVTVSKASPVVTLTNTSASTTAQFLAQSTTNRSILIGQFGDSSAGTTLGIANAAGALIATATLGANYPDKLVITTLGRAAPIYFGTNDTLALTLNGTTQAATFAGAVTVGGKITSAVSTATGYNQLYDTSGITTGRGAFAITSTGAALAFGIEASVGGTSFTGSAAYSSYFGTTNATPVYLVTNGVIRQTIDSTGAATFAGAVTVTGALKLGNAYVAGAVVGTGSITIQDSTGTTYRIPVLV